VYWYRARGRAFHALMAVQLPRASSGFEFDLPHPPIASAAQLDFKADRARIVIKIK
jgi:hypothetical protein